MFLLHTNKNACCKDSPVFNRNSNATLHQNEKKGKVAQLAFYFICLTLFCLYSTIKRSGHFAGIYLQMCWQILFSCPEYFGSIVPSLLFYPSKPGNIVYRIDSLSYFLMVCLSRNCLRFPSWIKVAKNEMNEKVNLTDAESCVDYSWDKKSWFFSCYTHNPNFRRIFFLVPWVLLCFLTNVECKEKRNETFKAFSLQKLFC